VDFTTAKGILAALEHHGVRYVMVGSMAMAAHGLVRATRDLDIFVAPDDDNVGRLRAALKSLFDDPSIDEITGTDLQGDYPAVSYAPPAADYTLDILSRLGEAFSFDDIEAEDIDVGGVSVRVATPHMLYRMKKDTVRPQDRADAEALKSSFALDEES